MIATDGMLVTARELKKIDKRIEQAYYRTCDAGATEEKLEAAIVAFVATIRKN